MSRDEKVVDFPKTEVTPEERARRLKVEVERLASLPQVEWLFYVSDDAGVAEKHGVSRAVLREMVEATIRANEKKAREDKAEDRQREKRAEKAQTRARREEERKQREQEQAQKAAERKRQERDKEFAAIAKLPRLVHEVRLAELAKRSGEDLEILRGEFAAFRGTEDSIRDVEPWPEPVETAMVLTEVMAQLRRYVILHDDVAVAITLWVAFAWVHEVAVHSPILVVTSAEADSGKTTTLGVIERLTPRQYSAVELTGANVYRIVDRLNPTLIIDEADQLFQRKTGLAHVVNAGWGKGVKIPRMVRGEIQDFDPFCPKAIGMKGLSLPTTTASRAIICKLWPKLLSEQIEDFRHIDDDTFKTLRRKLIRWTVDNAAVLRDANPIMPAGFGNRLAANWRLLLAIADLAGGRFAEQARTAAIKLSHKRHQPSEGQRLLAAFQMMFAKHKMLSSDEVVRRLNADKEAEWCDFRNHGPITKRQVSLLLDQYDIDPDVIHPTSGKSARGYKAEWFKEAFARHLPNNRTTVRKAGKKRRKKPR
jgi:hypothetical protein